MFGPKMSGSPWNPDYQKTTVHNPLRQLFSNILRHIVPIVFQYTSTKSSTTTQHTVTQTTRSGKLGV
jgi:hypothetical protein